MSVDRLSLLEEQGAEMMKNLNTSSRYTIFDLWRERVLSDYTYLHVHVFDA